MTYGYVEDLTFAVEVFDEGGNLKEVLARLHDLDAARGLHSLPREVSGEAHLSMPGRPDLAEERPGSLTAPGRIDRCRRNHHGSDRA